jgi:dipeptidyl aminopeptidase/acylaminoacyl peptidase
VFVDNAIIAAAPETPQIMLGDEPMNLNAHGIQVAPDGSRVAYTLIDAEGRIRFYTLDTRDGAQQLHNDMPNVNVIGPRFSPNSQELAVAVIDQNNMPDGWQLQVKGPNPDSVRVLEQFVRSSPSDHLAPLSPIAWTENGLYVERLLWASDAPPHGIVRVDPQSGEMQVLNDEDHIRAEISPDGTRAARLTGILPMGPDVDAERNLSIVDLQSGQEQPLFTGEEFWVPMMRWAPDGTRLMYAKQNGMAGLIGELVITGPDGSNQQTLAFGEGGVPGALQDAAWRDADTLLLLVADGNNTLHLYELPVDNLSASALQELGSFGGSQVQGVMPRILYVPRLN